MTAQKSKLVVPLWEYRHPPNGLTDEWHTNYLVVIDPATRVAVFSPDKARVGSRELFEAWSVTLRQSMISARAVLNSIQGRSPRTWQTGHSILKAVTPIDACLTEAVRFLAFPRDVAREGGTGVQPTRQGRAATADSLRLSISDKLCKFLDGLVPLLEEFAAAVVDDCTIQRVLASGPVQPQPKPAQGKPYLKPTPRKSGNPGLDENTRRKMVKEYADYKASSMTRKQYLRNRGFFPGMNEPESLAHLERCRKHWEQENRGK